MASKITLYFNHFGGLADAIKPRCRVIVEKTAINVKNLSQASMIEPKTGLWYNKSKSGKMHQASAPGEAPAIDTGNLANSHEVVVVSDTLARVDVHATYAEVLEFSGARVAARPFLRPAMSKAMPAFEKALQMLLDAPTGTAELTYIRTFPEPAGSEAGASDLGGGR